MGFSPNDGFSTAQMIQAERELDSRINFAYSRARELQEKVAKVEEKLAKDTKPLTDQEVDQFRAYVLGHARTEKWELVIARINRGELTWRQVVEGMAEGRLDPDVAAAFTSLSKVPPASEETLVSIGVLPDLNAAATETEADTSSAATADYDDDDDEWNEDQSIFNR